jgi:hypothetical protein
MSRWDIGVSRPVKEKPFQNLCLRGVWLYPSGQLSQSRHNMSVSVTYRVEIEWRSSLDVRIYIRTIIRATLYLFLLMFILAGPNTSLGSTRAIATNRFCLVTLFPFCTTNKTTRSGTRVVSTRFGWIGCSLAGQTLLAVHMRNIMGFCASK